MSLPFEIMIITDEEPALLPRLERTLSRPFRTPLAVQLRRKQAGIRELRQLGLELRALTRGCGAQLLINGRVDVALEVGADGVHLPSHGISVQVARAMLPAGAALGVSCHTRAELVRATREGADYAILSPVRPVDGKAPALGIAGFAQLTAAVQLPVIALGGITPADVSALRSAGAAGFAIRSAIMASSDPATVLARLCTQWDAVA